MKTPRARNRTAVRIRRARTNWRTSVRSRTVFGLPRLGEGPLLAGIPTLEEAMRRIEGRPSFLDLLTPELLEEMRNHPEIDFLGSPDGPKRDF